MRIKETKVYKFDELSEKAKEKARDWWREGYEFDAADFILEDAATIANLLGIELKLQSVPLMSGKTRNVPAIYYSGFCTQGSGACFEGTYHYKAGALDAIKEHAPTDEKLHRIAAKLEAIQAQHAHSLVATVTHTGHYSHAYSTTIEVEHNSDECSCDREAVDPTIEVEQALHRFMDWIYIQLETEFRYQMSDEATDENILSNEYEFDEHGRRA